MSTQVQYEIRSFEDWRETAGVLPTDPKFSQLAPAVLAHLESTGILTVISESDYVDFDYAAAYAHFYSYNFRPPPRLCTRHLFFSHSFNTITALHKPAVRRSFQGFITVWPTNPPVIGRSVLPFPSPGTDDQFTVEAPYVVHVAGEELVLHSAMFASKDHAVSACATIATWLSTDLLHRRFALPTCSSSEITLLATGNDPKWGRAFPQTYGLDAEQITRALAALGYGPHIRYFDPDMRGPVERDRTWIGIVYGYLLSGFPVILMCEVQGVGNHAILAVGLRTSENSGQGTTPTGNLGTRSFARTVTSLLVHDDRFGPFGILTPDFTTKREGSIAYPGGVKNRITLMAVIVPLPAGVNLVSDDAHALGVQHLLEFFRSPELLDEGDYVGPFQTYLSPSTDFKKNTFEINRWQSAGSSSRKRLRDIAFPKWVWVTEAYPDYVRTNRESDPIARAVYDSTQLPFGDHRLLLGGHIYRAFFDGVGDMAT